MIKRLFLLPLFVLLFGLMACGAPETAAPDTSDSDSASSPTVAATLNPTIPPTKKPISSPTLIPAIPADSDEVEDAEEVEVEDEDVTSTDSPTATPRSTATSEPTDEPESSDSDTEIDGAPLYLGDPAQFAAESRNPLTGEIVDAELLNRRPILCKISNSPKKHVLPQSGLNAADIIFEHYAEYSLTRFSALFYGETPERVGPVRSARLLDLELPLMYDAALCYSGGSYGEGANEGVWDKVKKSTFADRAISPSSDVYYRTGEAKPIEHTFYSELEDAWTYLDSVDQNQPPAYSAFMTFSEELPFSADASEITIQYSENGDTVRWEYDPEIDKYRRFGNGEPVIDAIDEEQVTASNVVVLYAPHYEDRNICETQGETSCLAFSTEIQIWGGGFVQLFRNGRQINGSWARPDRDQNGQMFTFQIEGDDNPNAGQVMPLAVGNTWFQFVPYDEYLPTTITIEK